MHFAVTTEAASVKKLKALVDSGHLNEVTDSSLGTFTTLYKYGHEQSNKTIGISLY